MKKLFSLILAAFVVIAYLFTGSVAFAQTPTPEGSFDYKRAYQDFVFTYDQYRQIESEFEIARAQYVQSKTLAAEAKAREATYKLLQSRDEVVKTYLTTLRLRISEAVGVSQDKREVLYTLIDTEVKWFDDHKNQTSSAGSLNDLRRDSDKAKNRYQGTSEGIAYDALAAIAVGKEYFLRQKQLSIIADLENMLSEIRQEPDGIDTDLISRSIIEVQNRLTRSETKEQDAIKLQEKLVTTAVNARPRQYNQIIFTISEAVQYMREGNTYLKEIIQRIRRV